MSLGDAWKDWMGECDRDTAFSILDHFYNEGGNFIDTSNNYQDSQSEMRIGEWMKNRNIRHQMVIGTKYTSSFHAGRGDSEIMANFQGNGANMDYVPEVEAIGRK